MEELDRTTLGVLLGMMAHDLRNTLSALFTNADYLGTIVPAGEADAREALRDLVLSCRALERLVGNVALIARAIGGWKPRPQRMSMSASARAAVQRAAAAAAAHGIGVDAPEPAQPGHVRADPDLIGAAIDNAIANAIQHSPPRGSVVVEVGGDGDRAWTRVRDAGPVVPAGARERVLEATGQAEAKRNASWRHGRGLSLLCAAETARAAGGAFAVGERGGMSELEVSAPVDR